MARFPNRARVEGRGMIFGIALLILGFATPGMAAEVLLVEEGEPVAALVVSDEPDGDELLAARELQEHIERMSGARLEIVGEEGAAGRLEVRIGAGFDPGMAKKLWERSEDPGAFVLSVTKERIGLVGNSPEGTLFAAYELLEQLGCRWFMPGELGRVIPQRKSVALQVGETVQVPSFSDRHLQNVSGSMPPWARRQRMGGISFPSSHGVSLLPGGDFETEPELFALIDGERRESQLCISNAEVVRRAQAAAVAYFDEHPEAPWMGMGPRDGGGFCECEHCMELDAGEIDPVSGEPMLTDRYVWLFNQVLEAVHEKYPEKRIGFYAYTVIKFPPKKQPVSPFLVPALAPISHDRIHGMSNPVSPDRSVYREVMEGWCRVVPEVYERGYYFNLACPGLPFSKIHAVRDETVVAHQLGVKGWRVETMPSWVSNGPTLYVAARLMWDADADVDALMADYYEKFFGPAAEPMGRYMAAVDGWFRDTECITGSSFCMPHVFTPERMANCKRWFWEARLLAADDPTFTERVRIFKLNHDRLKSFLTMLEARDQFDFAEAQAALDRLYELTEEMVSYRLYPAEGEEEREDKFEAYPVYPRVASYIDRFWSPCTKAGYARTVEHGELVASGPDEWDFLIDPSEGGEMLGWFRDGKIGGNWQRLRTSSESWSDQGLHYYKGLAWYRTAVEIPKRFRERKVFLWFGGVDEKAKVWVNGELVGESDVGTFKPFDLEVSEVVRFGERNVVAVEITNRKLNELGTGGITAPVMFWSPKSAAGLEAIFPRGLKVQ